MKTQVINITESGIPLLNPDDGFVVYGCILKGNGTGGLIGSGTKLEHLTTAGIDPTAYTNEEFIKALMIDPYELERIAKNLMLHERSFGDRCPR